MQSRPLPLFAVFENQNKFREKPHETADSFGVCNQICIEEFTNKQSDQFQTLCHIGSGSFSDVFKVSSKEDGNIYAIKWTRTRHLDDSDRRTSLHDLYMLQQVVQHPNLVDFNRSWIQKGEIFTQQELCENGNLTSYLIHNDKLDEKVIWKLLFDIVLAVKQLHGQQIIHFDIKPDNIFISKNNYFKLGDFGLSHFKDFTSPISEGDSRYIAPEVLTQTLSTTSSDIFSIGVTVFEASERVIIPSDGPLWHKLREDPPHLEGRSQQLDQLVRSLLHSDPKCRPSVDIILHNPQEYNLF
ncbi:MAG: putative WEE protein kinase [Streblomastix strix]|uniref:Putative WEE protein kinase n=1 Tax=Streblomastix strix TaxID=222440 RepID=A0A5J4VQ48_9EUKA|nr:MAG: putative WEE protein kinase [Streblomastix strix]